MNGVQILATASGILTMDGLPAFTCFDFPGTATDTSNGAWLFRNALSRL